MVKALRKQDLIYSLTVCGRDGKDEAYEIGSLIDLIWGVEEPKAVLEKIADKSIKIITLTITEGGYNMDKTSGEFILDNEGVSMICSIPQRRRPYLALSPRGYAAGRIWAMALSRSFLAIIFNITAIRLNGRLPLLSPLRIRNYWNGCHGTSLSRTAWWIVSPPPRLPLISSAES